MNSQRLTGKVAIITGSGGGIGRCEALEMAKQGASVVVNDIAVDEHGKSRAQIVVDEITAAGGIAVAAPFTVSTIDGIKQIVDTAIDAFGRLDIVVNNAGLKRLNPIEHFPEKWWHDVVESHLKSAFFMTKHTIPWLKKSGGGVIVNIGSESGLGHPFNSAYSSAKEGMVGFTRTAARELGRFGIRCNLVRPRAGAVSATTAKAYEAWRPVMAALGRFTLGEQGHIRELTYPEQVAPFVVWLCTDKAKNINGRSFYVSGDTVGLWSEPELERTMINRQGWTLENLDEDAPKFLTHDLDNRFLFDNPFEGEDPFHTDLDQGSSTP